MIKGCKRFLATVLICALVISVSGILTHSQVSASAKTKKSAKFLAVKIGSNNMMKQTYTLMQGSTAKLTVETKPAKAKNSVTFKSSNKKIVKVSKKGKIKGLSSGTAKIKVIISGRYKKKTTWVKINVMKLVLDKPVIKAPTSTPKPGSGIQLL